MKRSRHVVMAAVALGLSMQFSMAVWADDPAAVNALTQARLALKQSDKAAAKALFAAVYEKFPDSRQAPAALLSHAYLVLADNSSLAEGEFRIAATRYPGSPEAPRAWLRIAYLRLKAGEPDAAIYLKLVADQYPGTVAAQEALFRMGRLSIRDKDYDKAQATLEAAEAAPGSDWTKSQALVHTGEVHMFRLLASKDKAELDKAAAILLHIEDKYPGEPRSIMQGRVDMARLYAFMGFHAGVCDRALARQILVDALPKWPDTYFTMEAHALVGFTYHYQGDDKSAVEYFEKMIKDYPKSNWNSMLLKSIGGLQQNLGESAKAIDAYNRCIVFDPNTDWAQSARKALAVLTANSVTAK